MIKLKQKKLLFFLSISSLLFLSNCSSVPNVPICAEVNLSKGICTYTVTGQNIIIDDEHPLDGQSWFDMRSKVLAVPASSWAKIKSWMIKQCKQSKKCSVDIDSWDRDLSKEK